MSREKQQFAYAKTKAHISFAVTAKLSMRLCFRYKDRTNLLLSKFKISSFTVIFCDCTDRFVSNLDGNHIVGFLVSRSIYCPEVCIFVLRLCIGVLNLIASTLGLSILTGQSNAFSLIPQVLRNFGLFK